MRYALAITLWFFGAFGPIAMADPPTAVTPMADSGLLRTPGSDQLLATVYKLADSNDLDGLERLAASIQQEMGRTHDPEYCTLIDALCRVLRSGNYGPSNIARKFGLSQEYALIALKEPDQLSLTQEIDLVSCLRFKDDLDYANGQISSPQWDALRVVRVRQYLHAWTRATSAIGARFDPSKIDFYLDVMPPRRPDGAQPMPGSPVSVYADPALREKYQAAIDANAAKARQYGEHRKAASLLTVFTGVFVSAMADYYSKSPGAKPELLNSLKVAGVDLKVQARILAMAYPATLGVSPVGVAPAN